MYLYHISFRNDLEGWWIPREPYGDDESTNTNSPKDSTPWPYPEPSFKRISLSTSLEGAFRGVYPNVYGYFEKEKFPYMEFNVYSPRLTGKEKIYTPEELTKNKWVWDAHVTKEHLIVDKVYMKHAGVIRVKNTLNSGKLETHAYNDSKNLKGKVGPKEVDIKIIKGSFPRETIMSNESSVYSPEGIISSLFSAIFGKGKNKKSIEDILKEVDDSWKVTVNLKEGEAAKIGFYEPSKMISDMKSVVAQIERVYNKVRPVHKKYLEWCKKMDSEIMKVVKPNQESFSKEEIAKLESLAKSNPPVDSLKDNYPKGDIKSTYWTMDVEFHNGHGFSNVKKSTKSQAMKLTISKKDLVDLSKAYKEYDSKLERLGDELDPIVEFKSDSFISNLMDYNPSDDLQNVITRLDPELFRRYNSISKYDTDGPWNAFSPKSITEVSFESRLLNPIFEL